MIKVHSKQRNMKVRTSGFFTVFPTCYVTELKVLAQTLKKTLKIILPQLAMFG
jgi:hypothetical protein